MEKYFEVLCMKFHDQDVVSERNRLGQDVVLVKTTIFPEFFYRFFTG